MTTPIKTVRQCQSCYTFWPTKNVITRCPNPKCSSTNIKRKSELTYSMHRKCKNCNLIYTWTATQKKRIEELLLPFPDNTLHEYFEAMQTSSKKRSEARRQQLNAGNQALTHFLDDIDKHVKGLVYNQILHHKHCKTQAGIKEMKRQLIDGKIYFGDQDLKFEIQTPEQEIQRQTVSTLRQEHNRNWETFARNKTFWKRALKLIQYTST